jgi:hypothetical protein
MAGGSEGTTTTTPVYNTTAGATGDLGYGTSTSLFNQGQSLYNQGPNQVPIGSFDSYGSITQPRNVDDGFFTKSLMDAITNPTYGVNNPNDTAMIDSLMDVTAGRGAVSGLGAPTQSSLMTSIAPTLADIRNREMGYLSTGREGDIAMRGQDVGMRGQDIGRNTELRGQDIGINAQNLQQWQTGLQALMEMIGLAMPQTVMTSNTQGETHDAGLLSGENLWGGSW